MRELEVRILDATVERVALAGTAGLTVAEIARSAGCGRATVYRVFPGGRSEILRAAVDRELGRFLDGLARQLGAVTTLEDAVTVGLTETARLTAHHPALRTVLDREPGVVLPYFSFHEVDHVYAAAGAFAGPHLRRFLGTEEARWLAEWVVRIVLSHVFAPSDTIDLTDPDDARTLARAYLLPALTPDTTPILQGS